MSYHTPTLVSQGPSGYAQGTGAVASGTFTVTLQQTPVNGNLLILTIIATGNSTSNPTVTGITQTNVVWSVAIAEDSSTTNDVEIWQGVVNVSAGTVITVTMAGGAGTCGEVANVCEWSGLASSPVDQTQVNAGVMGSSAASGTTAVTTQTVELWVACIGAALSVSGYITQSSPLNSFTLLDGAENVPVAGQYESNGYLYYVASATGAASTGVTLSGAIGYWSGCIATFKAASIGAVATAWIKF